MDGAAGRRVLASNMLVGGSVVTALAGAALLPQAFRSAMKGESIAIVLACGWVIGPIVALVVRRVARTPALPVRWWAIFAMALTGCAVVAFLTAAALGAGAAIGANGLVD
jgi:hypothetical protein